MSPTDTLSAIIARVEAATGPDRELDDEIALAIGINPGIWIGHELLGNLRHVPVRSKFYTASLDAAVSLVPSGHSWSLDFHPENAAEARTFYGTFAAGIIDEGAEAATPALALTAAALRAMASIREGQADE